MGSQDYHLCRRFPEIDTMHILDYTASELMYYLYIRVCFLVTVDASDTYN